MNNNPVKDPIPDKPTDAPAWTPIDPEPNQPHDPPPDKPQDPETPR